MKYLRQYIIILCFCLLGELLSWLIPFPIPASIYGLLLLFVALSAHILPLEAVNETGNFLLSIMPLLFIAPAVKMLDVWDSVRSFLLPILVLIAISTLVTFAVSGGVVQALINRGRSGGTDD